MGTKNTTFINSVVPPHGTVKALNKSSQMILKTEQAKITDTINLGQAFVYVHVTAHQISLKKNPAWSIGSIFQKDAALVFLDLANVTYVRTYSTIKASSTNQHVAYFPRD